MSVFQIDLQGISVRMPGNAIRNCLQIEFACRFLCFVLRKPKMKPKIEIETKRKHYKSNNIYNLVYMRISTYYLIKYIYYYLYNLTCNFNLLTNTKLRKFDTSKHYSIDDMNISIYVKFAFSIYIINVKQKDT